MSFGYNQFKPKIFFRCILFWPCFSINRPKFGWSSKNLKFSKISNNPLNFKKFQMTHHHSYQPLSSCSQRSFSISFPPPPIAPPFTTATFSCILYPFHTPFSEKLELVTIICQLIIDRCFVVVSIKLTRYVIPMYRIIFQSRSQTSTCK